MQKKNVRMTPQVRAYVTDRTEWLIRRSIRAPDDSARDDGMGLMKRVRRAWQQRACMPHGSSSSHGPLIIAMHRKMPTTTLQSSLSSCWLVSAPTAPCTHQGGLGTLRDRVRSTALCVVGPTRTLARAVEKAIGDSRRVKQLMMPPRMHERDL